MVCKNIVKQRAKIDINEGGVSEFDVGEFGVNEVYINKNTRLKTRVNMSQ